MSLVRDAVSIARRAGDAILEVYGREDFGTVQKSDASPLTLADKAAHELIVAALHALDPKIPVLSEESDAVTYEERAAWDPFWLVDPLDGTKEFIKRNGEFTVNIALIRGKRPVLGVVHAPVLGTTYWGAEGEGAYKSGADGQERAISVSDYRRVGLSVVASRSHAGELMPLFLQAVGDPPCVSSGSSLKFCLVAEGTANLYPRFGPTMEWDVAAAAAVVYGAGGTITDLEGNELEYNKPDLHNPYFVVCGSPAYPWKPALDSLAPEAVP